MRDLAGRRRAVINEAAFVYCKDDRGRLTRWAQGTAPVPTRVLGERMGLAQRTVAHRCARAEQLLADAVRTAEAA